MGFPKIFQSRRCAIFIVLMTIVMLIVFGSTGQLLVSGFREKLDLKSIDIEGNDERL